jgi:Acetyltransferase (GNAT) domain
MLSLEPLAAERVDWPRFDAFEDRVIFQAPEWLEFVSRTQGARPVFAAVRRDGEDVGLFTGLRFRRFGLPILGSPFPGWTTASMGFNLEPGVDRGAAARALVPFAFRELRCVHLELKDRHLFEDDVEGAAGYEVTRNRTLEVDLEDDESLFGGMTSACRRAIRKAEKTGVSVEEVVDEAFAGEYHEQLVEVFRRQGLRPPYGVERVQELIRCLAPTGCLLLLRARDPDGEPIATGIFPAMNRTAYFWGGASRRSGQLHRPNEAIFWYAMRYWRNRGMTVLDLGGGGEYKLKYGPRDFTVPFFRRSRIPGLGTMRNVAKNVLTRARR